MGWRQLVSFRCRVAARLRTRRKCGHTIRLCIAREGGHCPRRHGLQGFALFLRKDLPSATGNPKVIHRALRGNMMLSFRARGRIKDLSSGLLG